MVLIIVILLFAGWDADALGVALAVMAFVVGPFLLLYLLRVTSRNKGPLHGGGFEGANAAFGVLPFEARDYIPKISQQDSNGEVAVQPTSATDSCGPDNHGRRGFFLP
jgi:hypothetical protein